MTMITDTLQYELRERYNPNGSTLRRQQLRMFEMLQYIDTVCKNHGIRYWLCSGTLLGAVRHGGFIPWDDDVDIEMLREDYRKFVKVMATEALCGKYVLQNHDTDSNYFAPYGKLRDLHSYIKEENTNDLYYKYKGCYIDVFVLEPSSSFFLSRLGSAVLGVLLYRTNPVLKYGLLRRIYYACAYPLVYNIIFPILRLLSKYGAKGRMRLALGSFFFKSRDKKDIFPLQAQKFEGSLFPVPGKYDNYLRKIYGDYMKLPDLDKLIKHTNNTEIYEY